MAVAFCYEQGRDEGECGVEDAYIGQGRNQALGGSDGVEQISEESYQTIRAQGGDAQRE